MARIPLEDDFNDVINKAQRGLNISDADLAARAAVSLADLAAVKARLKLASEGKSFVVRNKVNPIAVAVQPVVDALNAPECDGLEAALAGLGMTVNAIDRSALDEAVEADTTDILAGLLVGEGAVAKLGKIAVALGVTEYNRFVSSYNGEPDIK